MINMKTAKKQKSTDSYIESKKSNQEKTLASKTI